MSLIGLLIIGDTVRRISRMRAYLSVLVESSPPASIISTRPVKLLFITDNKSLATIIWSAIARPRLSNQSDVGDWDLCIGWQAFQQTHCLHFGMKKLSLTEKNRGRKCRPIISKASNTWFAKSAPQQCAPSPWCFWLDKNHRWNPKVVAHLGGIGSFKVKSSSLSKTCRYLQRYR